MVGAIAFHFRELHAMPDSPPAPSVQEIVPLLIVEDIARSLDFYSSKLAFKMTANWEPGGKLQWCRLERDQAALMLQQACDEDGPAEGRGRGVFTYFNCSDVAVEHVRLASCGLKLAPPEVAFYGMKQLYFTDPDGYELCFQSAAKNP